MDEFLLARLSEFKERDEYRKLAIREVAPEYDFSSNDYLGFSDHQAILASTAQATRIGTCSSRLVSGTSAQHEKLEHELSIFLQQENSLVFGAGFLANLGVLSSLLSKGDTVFSDKLVHASLLDGIRLSNAKHRRFRHNNVEHLKTLIKSAQKKRRAGENFIIVVESVYSMDGDLAPLEALLEIAVQFDARLLVDEAHALGVFGDCGRGLVNNLQLHSPHIGLLGTLSKSFGCYGGIYSGSEVSRTFLINTSRAFIYNTALPQVIVIAARAALKLMCSQPGLGTELLDNASKFRTMLLEAGFDCCGSQSHIIPLLVGDNQKCILLSEQLYKEGISAIAIRPPTVAAGSARLRFSITRHHSPSQLKQIGGLIIETATGMGIL